MYMLRHIFITLSLIGFTTLSHSQEVMRKPVVCMTPEILFTQLYDDYKERPEWVWGNQTSDSWISLFSSEQGTWTLIEFNKTTACVLGMGVKEKALKN